MSIYAEQTTALRKSAALHRLNGNTWLANAMEYSRKYFAYKEKTLQISLDSLDEKRAHTSSRDVYAYTPESYIYDLEDPDFSDYRENWFNYNKDYCN